MALSVEIITNRSTLLARAASTTFRGPDNIIADRFFNIRLHEGQMFVGSGVEDNLGLLC